MLDTDRIPHNMVLDRPLSGRETEVLQGLLDCDGDRIRAAKHLCVTLRTLNTHLFNIYEVMGVRTLPEALIKALRDGLITLGGKL
jgi:DNA-binding NarL/FixJ family response regulator